MELSFVLSTSDRRAGIGDRLDTDGAPVLAWARVRGVPRGVVTFHTERGTVHNAVLPASGSGDVQWSTNAKESGFVRLEARHPDGRMAALSNPIALT